MSLGLGSCCWWCCRRCLPSQQDPSTILSKEELKAFVYQVLHDTHDNKSSMLQDILQQKRTEIQELNGYVVRIGQRYGLECPIHQELVERIQKLEANSQDDNDNDNDTPNNNRNPNQGSSIGWEDPVGKVDWYGVYYCDYYSQHGIVDDTLGCYGQDIVLLISNPSERIGRVRRVPRTHWYIGRLPLKD